LKHPVLERLFSHLPPEQFLRFLVVGLWNTVFGYATFVGFNLLLTPRLPEHGVLPAYIPAQILSSVLNITVAFFGYKWFIFKTKGNYWSEWVRCLAVYGSSMLIGVVLLRVMVPFVDHFIHSQRYAPYVAQAILMVFNVIYNFLGNKKFSFREGTTAIPETPPPPVL